jgi:phosphoglycolate phosphatase
MSDNPPPCGVIFDLDGTLADTLDDLADCLNTALVDLGFARVEPDRLRWMIGDGLPALLQRAAATDDPLRLERLLEHYRAIYRHGMLNRTKLFAGIAGMLDRLAERAVPMTVLSNKSHEFTVPMCDSLLARWPFRRFQGMTEEARKKPEPTAALELARMMERPPEQVYFVGDSSIDVETGQRAGMRTIGVTWGLRDRGHLVAAGPDHIVEQPASVADVILRPT